MEKCDRICTANKLLNVCYGCLRTGGIGCFAILPHKFRRRTMRTITRSRSGLRTVLGRISRWKNAEMWRLSPIANTDRETWRCYDDATDNRYCSLSSTTSRRNLSAFYHFFIMWEAQSAKLYEKLRDRFEMTCLPECARSTIADIHQGIGNRLIIPNLDLQATGSVRRSNGWVEC